MGKADSAVHLMRHRCGQRRGFTGTHLGHGNVERQGAAAAHHPGEQVARAAQGNLHSHSRSACCTGHLC
ncbi:hypothetical protein D3C75_1072760 [compost metagenome]